MKLSAQQRRVIATAGVTLIGMDEKHRPVVTAMVGIPNRQQTWAILRNGDPTAVTGMVKL